MNLIMKYREQSLKLRGIQALVERLEMAPLVLLEELRIRKAGFEGEKQFDYIMREFRPDYPYAFVHDITLKSDGIYFQIDSLCLTPFACFIFEVKNLGGKVSVKEDPLQFIHQKEDGQKIINPIAEVERKAFFLRKWLLNVDVSLPIQTIVTFAYTNELHIPRSVEEVLLPIREVPFYMYRLKVGEFLLTNDELFQLAQLISRHDCVYNPFPILKQYPIEINEIKRGVKCSKCNSFGMIWTSKTWFCSHCKHCDYQAHVDLIRDWFMIFDRRLTNRQFRWFSGISDPDVAKRLLKRAPVRMIGKHKATFYIIDSLY